MDYYLKLPKERTDELLNILQARFEKNIHRHRGFDWPKIKSKLVANPQIIWALSKMEETEGEPDVVGYDKDTDQYLFYDCSPESPKGRRSLCYDPDALESRKEHKPKSSAIAVATEMHIELLSEIQYRELHNLGTFDTKTSSWIATPADIREKGGALFCDFRFGHVFVYHNGAESYYAARGFRGSVRV